MFYLFIFFDEDVSLHQFKVTLLWVLLFVDSKTVYTLMNDVKNMHLKHKYGNNQLTKYATCH